MHSFRRAVDALDEHAIAAMLADDVTSAAPMGAQFEQIQREAFAQIEGAGA
ncbi:hypothetical protein ACFQZZ_03385 [Nocardia sp. GCM10030253]|uniref:hypothetical protein n=1 Tax=Nocardia sp. GCM10030253 TaxID=3273404 RepID=UPI00362A05DD